MDTRKYIADGREIEVIMWPKGNTMDNIIVRPVINGEYADLTRATDLQVSLRLACSKFKSMPATNIRIEGGVIRFSVRGEDQRMSGLYKLVVQYTVDGSLRTFGGYPFALTPVGSRGGGESMCPGIELPELALSMEISIASAGGGTDDHRELTPESRSATDQHPIEAISGLREALDDRALSSEIPTKTSDLENDSGFITEIPPEYVTEAELEAKGYATAQSVSDLDDRVDGVEAIAKGATAALVFDTKQQLTDWLAGTYQRPDGKTPADLVPGWHLLINEVDVPDYWWDGTGIQPLETGKVDLTDYYNRRQVDDKFDGKVDKTNAASRLYATDAGSGQVTLGYSQTATPGAVPIRETDSEHSGDLAVNPNVNGNFAIGADQVARERQEKFAIDKAATIPTSEPLNVEMPDPENLGQTIIKRVLTEDDIPPAPTLPKTDVTHLFIANIEVPSLLIEKTDRHDGRSFIKIRGHNLSGQQLVLTAPGDMGSLNALKPIIHPGEDENGAAGLYECVVTQATDQAPTTLTFDKEIQDLNVFYEVGITQAVTKSYVVDRDGIAYEFARDLPYTESNLFFNTARGGEIQLIDGNYIGGSMIAEIHYGTDYDDITDVPNRSWEGWSYLTLVTLPRNVITIGNQVLVSTALKELVIPSKVTTIGDSIMLTTGDFNLQYLELPTSLINLDLYAFFVMMPSAPSNVVINIKGFDASLDTILFSEQSFQGWPNTGTIIGHTQDVIDKFKAKWEDPQGSKFANWTEVVDPNS